MSTHWNEKGGTLVYHFSTMPSPTNGPSLPATLMEQTLLFTISAPKNFLSGLQLLSSLLPKPGPIWVEDTLNLGTLLSLPTGDFGLTNLSSHLSHRVSGNQKILVSLFSPLSAQLSQLFSTLPATVSGSILQALGRLAVQLLNLGEPALSTAIFETLLANLEAPPPFNLEFIPPSPSPSQSLKGENPDEALTRTLSSPASLSPFPPPSSPSPSSSSSQAQVREQEVSNDELFEAQGGSLLSLPVLGRSLEPKARPSLRCKPSLSSRKLPPAP